MLYKEKNTYIFKIRNIKMLFFAESNNSFFEQPELESEWECTPGER